MTASPVCPLCGGVLENGRCPACDRPALARLVQREIAILVILSVVAVIAFLGTRALARLDADVRERDAASWYRSGHAHLAAGQPDAAADAFHRASAMSRDHDAYRLAHAAALIAADRDDAARQVLLGIRTTSPENTEANLRLARLEVRRGDATAAVRYYQHALYGVWREEDADARRAVRIELIEFLIDQEQHSRALAELLALEGQLAPEPDAYLEAARLFRRAGDARRALGYYERTLGLEPKHGEATAGAGEAAFSLGDLPRAARHLRLAPDDRPEVVELRAITSFVLTRDPLAARLAYAERRRRLLLNVETSIEHLDDCQADESTRPVLDGLREEAGRLRADLERRTAPVSLETIESGVDLVYRIERTLAERCGTSGAAHQALLLIGERHQVPDGP